MLDYLSVAGLLLTENRADEDTITRDIARIEGLTGLPSNRGDTLDRPTDHGVVEPSAQYLDARVVTIEGEIWSQVSVDDAWAQWDSVVGVLAAGLSEPGVTVTWRRAGGSRDLTGTARIVGDAQPSIDGFQRMLAYQIQLRFADPTWYDNASQVDATSAPVTSPGLAIPLVFPIVFGGVSGGIVNITNAGNAKTWPRLTVAGPINGPVIQNVTHTKALYFDGLSLAETETLIVETNPAARSATVSGTNVLGALRWADSTWFPLEPGIQTIQFYGQGGGYTPATSLTVAWQDGYYT